MLLIISQLFSWGMLNNEVVSHCLTSAAASLLKEDEPPPFLFHFRAVAIAMFVFAATDLSAVMMLSLSDRDFGGLCRGRPASGSSSRRWSLSINLPPQSTTARNIGRVTVFECVKTSSFWSTRRRRTTGHVEQPRRTYLAGRPTPPRPSSLGPTQLEIQLNRQGRCACLRESRS